MTEITVQSRRREPVDRSHVTCPMCGLHGDTGREFASSELARGQQAWRCSRCGSDLVVHRGRFRTRAEWAGFGTRTGWAGGSSRPG